MDKYDERAEKVYSVVCEALKLIPFKNQEAMSAIAAALREAVEEAVKNTMDNASEWIPNKTRASALEEAARIAEECNAESQALARICATKIRALKEAK